MKNVLKAALAACGLVACGGPMPGAEGQLAASHAELIDPGSFIVSQDIKKSKVVEIAGPNGGQSISESGTMTAHTDGASMPCFPNLLAGDATFAYESKTEGNYFSLRETHGTGTFTDVVTGERWTARYTWFGESFDGVVAQIETKGIAESSTGGVLKFRGRGHTSDLNSPALAVWDSEECRTR